MKRNLLPVVIALQMLALYQAASSIPNASAADAKTKTSLVLSCMMNCGQCKEMYGDYFDGRRCAEFCLTGAGAKLPDCNVPDTVDRFFKTGDQALRESNAVEVERGSGDMWKRFMGIKRRYLSRPSYL